LSAPDRGVVAAKKVGPSYLSPSLHRRFSDLRRHLGAIAGSVGNDCDWCEGVA